jgi:hypothetical protein
MKIGGWDIGFDSLGGMRPGLGTRVLAVLALGAGIAWGQRAATGAISVDKEMELAETMVGKALFLRGFYLINDLSYDSEGA